ncbi:MAG: hypothetical protein Q9163_002539 [Psora crenata]
MSSSSQQSDTGGGYSRNHHAVTVGLITGSIVALMNGSMLVGYFRRRRKTRLTSQPSEGIDNASAPAHELDGNYMPPEKSSDEAPQEMGPLLEDNRGPPTELP